jgi:hypothetical protein
MLKSLASKKFEHLKHHELLSSKKLNQDLIVRSWNMINFKMVKTRALKSSNGKKLRHY